MIQTDGMTGHDLSINTDLGEIQINIVMQTWASVASIGVARIWREYFVIDHTHCTL